MPRLACKDAREYRFTLGDYERSQIIKPLKKKLEHDTYLEYAKVLVWPVAVIGSAWFIGKGISGIWDDAKEIIDDIKNIIPATGAGIYEGMADLFGGINREAYEPIDPDNPWGK